jgi:hypothetical protein
MAAQLDLTCTAAFNGSAIAAPKFSEAQEGAIVYDFILAANSTNHQLNSFAFALANVKAMFFYFDKDVTLKTNSTGSPQETLSFKAGVWWAWDKDMPWALTVFFAGAVTAGYLTSGASATVCKIYIVLDS